jgi:hypothetical protein
MSGERTLNRRLHQLNRRDVRDLAGERLESQAQRLVDNGLVTAMRAEGDTLRGRVREKAGQSSTAVKLRLPDGHPALTWALELLEPDSTAAFSLFEAALLLAWAQQQNTVVSGVVISSSGSYAISGTSSTLPFEPSASLDAFAQMPSDALWRGMRGPYANLSALLLPQRVTDLRRIAKRLGLGGAKEAKETLLPQLAPRLLLPETTQAMLDSLSALQRTLLTLLILRDSGMPPYALNETAQRLQLTDNAGLPGIAPQVSDGLNSLHAAGLIFAANPSHDYASDHQAPLELAAHYRPRIADLPNPPQSLAEEPASVSAPPDLLATLRGLVMTLRAQPRHAPEPIAAHDLERNLVTLRAWSNDRQELTQLQQHKKDVWRWHYDNKIQLTICPPAPMLLEQNIIALAQEIGSTPQLLLRMLDALALLSLKHSDLIVSDQVETLLSRPVEEQRRWLAITWAYMTNWSEVHDLDDLQLRRNMLATSTMRPDQLYAELAAARRFVLRLLRAFEPDQWYRLRDIIALVQAIHPAFLFEQRRGQSSADGIRPWWLSRGKQPLDPAKPSDWQYGEGRLLRHMLTGPLSWLGLIEIGGAQSEFIRMTPVGAYLLGLRAQYERRSSGRALQVAVDPDMTRITVRLALSDAVPAVLQVLEQIAQARGLEQGVLVYIIMPRTLRDGFLHGQTVASVQDFVRQHAHEPLPAAALDLLAQWGAGFGQATIYSGLALIELADDLLLLELRRSARMERGMLEQLSPRLILVDPAVADDLFDELVAKGYTPRRMNAP